MAWLDDRFWCHPKVVGLSSDAFRAYVNGLTYCSGFGLEGRLTTAQTRTFGCTRTQCVELVRAGLWEWVGEDGDIVIHDWKEHNGKRDARRKADRLRKRASRNASAGQGADKPADIRADTLRTDVGQVRGRARVEGSEGSDGSEEDQEQDQKQALTRRKPNVVWDFVSEIAGEPLDRHRTARGAVVSDLTQLLERESVAEPDRSYVLHRRIGLLAREWGDAKATPRALVQNWELAARLDRGTVRGPANGRVTAMDMVAQTREAQRRELDDGSSG